MGIDSLTAHGVVDIVMQAGLLGKGAGNVVLKLAQKNGTDVRSAAAAIIADRNLVSGLFESSTQGAENVRK
jgi:D-ornithine 4,5-aminomutase subunit alpha